MKKLTYALLVTLIIAGFVRLEVKQMQLGDEVARLIERASRNESVTEKELGAMRLELNSLQTQANQISGLVASSGGLDTSWMPFAVLHSETFVVATTSIEIEIPSEYNNLMIFGSCRSTRAGELWDYIQLRFNGDSGTNYELQQVRGLDDTPGASQVKAATHIGISGCPGDSQAAYHMAGFHAVIINAKTTNTYKNSISINGARYTATTNLASTSSSWWMSTEPIEYITLDLTFGNFAAGTTFVVVGYK